MNKITIVGLGEGLNDLQVKGLNAIKSSDSVVVRTVKTQSYKSISHLLKNVTALDYVYDKSRNFDTLSKNLCKAVLDMAKQSDVVYLVDGCACEDSSVKEIISKHKNIEIIAGVSSATKCLEKLNVSLSEVYSASSYDVVFGALPKAPAVIYAVDSKHIASELKLALTDLFGEETEIFVVSNFGVKKIKLYELDRQLDYDYSTKIYIPQCNYLSKTRFNFNDLMQIIRELRSENGCPWDRVQTPRSIEKNLIEEAYELIDAVENDNEEGIVEETGDILLQAGFYVLFGEESGSYTLTDVISGVCSKLISRHTHVFGKDKATSKEDALNVWNSNKTIEKGYKNGGEYIDSLPSSLPACLRAQKVGSRAGKYNFDFSSYEQVFEKIYQEIEEIKDAIKNSPSTIEEELGDLMFSSVNAVRKLGFDAETVLYKATNKFINRFKKLENAVLSSGKNLKDLTEQEVDEYYKLIK